MPFIEREKYIREKLFDEGINIETQDYVVKYVNLNQELFGDIINIDKVIERITNNLKHSISRFEGKSIISSLLGQRGSWSPYENKIRQNPLLKLWSSLSKKGKDICDSNIMHELDHCATTEYLDIDKKQKEEYIQQYVERNKLTKVKSQQFKYRIDKLLQKFNGTLAISGIMDFRQQMKYGIQTRKLNEGITAYKQGLYDELLGKKPHTGYQVEKDVARFIADTIGREELISKHFNNDYDGIRETFKEKTGNDLNELVNKLNKKSYIKSIIFGKMYTKRFSRELNAYIENPGKDKLSKVTKRNVDFVPKCEIDYLKVKENMRENKIQQQQTIDNKDQLII